MAIIVGTDGDDVLTGGAGYDTLDGKGGADVLSGGDGIDLLLGGSGNDRLIGGNGDDALDGGADIDIMEGGPDNDIYTVDDAGDVVIELAGEGTDTVNTALASYSLSANVEILRFFGTEAFAGTGNELGNSIVSLNGVHDDILKGLDGDDTLIAGDGNDALDGGNGNDWLEGGVGADVMTGGPGDDIYFVDDTPDSVIEYANQGNDTVRTALTAYTLTANVEILLFDGAGAFAGTGNDLANVIGIRTASGNDMLRGMAGDDALSSGAGDDSLDGGTGVDLMAGGVGNDTYFVDDPGDVVTEYTGEGNDLVYSTISYTLGSNIERLALLGDSATTARGNDLDNAIVGNDIDNVLDGGAGADTMSGHLGDDTFIVDDVNDQVIDSGVGNDTVITSVSYRLGVDAEVETMAADNALDTSAINLTGNRFGNRMVGNAGSNTLHGGGGDDRLEGLDGTDILWGDKGADLMIGGNGNDLYVMTDLLDTVVEPPGGGNDTVSLSLAAGGIFTLGDNVERLAVAGTSIEAHGNAQDNKIVSHGVGNSLYGEGGNDTLLGDGNADALNGGAGNDWLDGGAGADVMTGGAGDDTYVVDDARDVMTEQADEGTDTIRMALASYMLAANFENLVYTGTAAFAGTGNELANIIDARTAGSNDTLRGMAGADTLHAGAGNDSLDGGTGIDAMYGGAGDDIYYVDDAADQAVELANQGSDTVRSTVSYALGANIETLILAGNASSGTGNAGDNVLIGNGGHNILDGGAGADRMEGGPGDDTYYIDNAGDLIVETGTGLDRAIASVSYALRAGVSVETLTTDNDSGTAAINLTGNDLANRLVGNAGANTLHGGGGNDRLEGLGGNDILWGDAGTDLLIGGNGDDLYVVTNVGDTILETANGGADRVSLSLATGGTFMLANYVETLVVAGDGIEAHGNAQDNRIVNGATGSSLWGEGGNDALIGSTGTEALHGGTGNDRITGGAGDDTLWGDAGKDLFAFATGSGTDEVADFTHGADRIDLTGYGIASLAQVQTMLSQSGANAVIDLGGGNAIRLDNIAGGDLTASDFVFAPAVAFDAAMPPDTLRPLLWGGAAMLPLTDL